MLWPTLDDLTPLLARLTENLPPVEAMARPTQ